MPLYKTIKANLATTTRIWHITETEADLHKAIQLSDSCRKRLAGMRSELHRRGFLSVRQLLKIAGYKPSQLFYDSKGRPHLSDGKHISITHSFEMAAVIISDKTVGIDIEKQRAKIRAIAHRFTLPAEGSEPEQIRKLTYIWCIKESLYKAANIEGLSFKDHIFIEELNIKNLFFRAYTCFKDQKVFYSGRLKEINGFAMAWTVPRNKAVISSK